MNKKERKKDALDQNKAVSVDGRDVVLSMETRARRGGSTMIQSRKQNLLDDKKNYNNNKKKRKIKNKHLPVQKHDKSY